jgi:hypothetical protein
MAGRDHRVKIFSIAVERSAMENHSAANAAEKPTSKKF